MAWKPRLDSGGKPKYLALVDGLEADIASGRLREGDRLPPQRDIATDLGVTIATVTRAFGEASRRGLVAARTGSGTFVRSPAPSPDVGPRTIDLSLNTVPLGVAKALIEEALRELVAEGGAGDAFGYEPSQGSERHRRVVRVWFGDRIPSARRADVSLTHGAQHGLAACFAALVRPGDTVLTERWTYTGIRRLAAIAGAQLVGVDLDGEGLCPEALASAFGRTGARVVVCSSVTQNPTSATMSLARRREIVAVCRAHDALIIEDDIYGRLSGDAEPSLAAIEPSRVVFLSSVSKSVSPGMRLGVLASPPHLTSNLRDKLISLHWTAPSFFAELFARMQASGRAEECLAAHRREMERRMAVARDLFGPPAVPMLPSYHLWLEVPAGWRLDDVVAELGGRGVRVSPSSHFLVDDEGQSPSFARICLGAVEDVAELTAALQTVSRLWSSPPRLSGTII